MGEAQGMGWPAGDGELFSDEDLPEIVEGAEVLRKRVNEGGRDNLIASASGEPTKVISTEVESEDRPPRQSS